MVTNARCGVCIGDDRRGFGVSMRSRMLPDSMRVGRLPYFIIQLNLLIISSSLLCLLAVLVFVVC